MRLHIYEILKKLSNDYPNDMEFGSKLRQIIKEIEGDSDNILLSKIVGSLEAEIDSEKITPKKSDLEKLESYLSNFKTNQNGVQ